MNRSDEVEFCNLEMKFDRPVIQTFIKSLIQLGYSLYWNENDRHFLISVRSGRRLVKLKFVKVDERLKIVGDYCLRDEKLAELLEKLIEDTRGNAVVKRFHERQIVVENFMYGELIRQVEINGVDHKVLFEKAHVVTPEQIIEALRNKRAENRAEVLRMEIDELLERLSRASGRQDTDEIHKCIQGLQALRREMIELEM